MQIEFKEITIRELSEEYADDYDGGVVGYGGKLNIRPPYQREFIYKDKQRDAVIETVLNGYPLNVMYWAVCDDGHFELIDGQQRTISICQYVRGNFSVDGLAFQNRQSDIKEKILNYKLTIYFCSGTDSEKLKWFETINIAGEKLSSQELRNAIYSGSWITDAKRYFSKNTRQKKYDDYMAGSAIRQDYLETVIKWISNNHIEDYMSKHQHDASAEELWLYYKSVIQWVENVFKVRRKKEMNGLPWGFLYNEYKDNEYDADKMEEQVSKLMENKEVQRKSGIYEYLLTGKEKHLNLRTFDGADKRTKYEEQKGICPYCNNEFGISEMEGDHIKPWIEGGKTELDNLQMLCKECNRRKGKK